ncbi:MAG: hypothetical protein Q4G58_11255 [bacterium]|nr:hypothetical protein [bacterium]
MSSFEHNPESIHRLVERNKDRSTRGNIKKGRAIVNERIIT